MPVPDISVSIMADAGWGHSTLTLAVAMDVYVGCRLAEGLLVAGSADLRLCEGNDNAGAIMSTATVTVATERRCAGVAMVSYRCRGGQSGCGYDRR